MYWTRKDARALASLAVKDEIQHHNECTCRCDCDEQISSWVPLEPNGEAEVIDAILGHLEMEMQGVRRDLREHYAQSLSIVHSAIGATLAALHHLFSLGYLTVRAIKFLPRYLDLLEQQGFLEDIRCKYKAVLDERCEYLGTDTHAHYIGLMEEGRIWSDREHQETFTHPPDDPETVTSKNARPTLQDESDFRHLGTQEETRILLVINDQKNAYRCTTRNDTYVDDYRSGESLLNEELTRSFVPPSDKALQTMLKQSTWERPREV